jgi:hypothetical protein
MDQAKTVMVGFNVSVFCSDFTTAYNAMSFEFFSSQIASAGTGSGIGLVLWLSVASVEVLERDDDESANEDLLSVRRNVIHGRGDAHLSSFVVGSWSMRQM